MKSQERRDYEAVTMGAGLLLFLLVTAGGAVVLLLVHQFVRFGGWRAQRPGLRGA
jgi:hypothetical protein